ncbi:LOW QUALITY PROTEIN: reverse transcriptase [Phytophthora megakarya]|uniref:Reverse transcriptase n=1 Tax=Phytophthora megakarya TaxID=4795 RepID=A0A225WA11_9STRA|nr:LOW QUALITY PROTEIN: reverse transcriptase [Phytophthora megakarya]
MHSHQRPEGLYVILIWEELGRSRLNAFRGKLAELIKGLLSAKMINHSRSPWASPIVVIIKKNGLMVYPMPLINDLLEDLESTLWYRLRHIDVTRKIFLCIVKRTDRAHLISAFITPFGLFEWNRMPLGLKNAPQIYHRMIDNALDGFTRIPKTADDPEVWKYFKVGEQENPGKPSVLGRRSYIDDIFVPPDNWGWLCDRVEDLLEACNKWNLSISVVISFWGMSKVEYLGHKVSHDGLEANPKDLSALTDLEFSRSLRAMQSFLSRLNYCSRFIEDFEIYTSVLYELRELDYAAMEKGMNRNRIQLALAVESPDPDMLTEDPTSPQPSDPDPRGLDPELSEQVPSLDPMPACVKVSNPEKATFADLDPRWIHAHRSFKVLKEKVA